MTNILVLIQSNNFNYIDVRKYMNSLINRLKPHYIKVKNINKLIYPACSFSTNSCNVVFCSTFIDSSVKIKKYDMTYIISKKYELGSVVEFIVRKERKS